VPRARPLIPSRSPQSDSAEARVAAPEHRTKETPRNAAILTANFDALLPSAPAAGTVTAAAAGWSCAEGPFTPLQSRLEAFGLLPAYARRVGEEAHRRLAARASPSPAEELAAAAAVLSCHWREPSRTRSTPDWHVFVGPAGTGKTTCLCSGLPKRCCWRIARHAYGVSTGSRPTPPNP